MKFKHLLVLCAVFAVLTNTIAQNKSIQFEEGDWNSIVAKAQSANKPIFVDAYAVWCGPCKWMSATVFTN
ncbi:MAG TPA: thioredoxin family protein, partial [Taishania sp.]|nr:thioredoxin family protein [Taishania sp.]